MAPLVHIRPWQAGDADLLLAAASLFTTRTLSSRFRTATPYFPPAYLRSLQDPVSTGRSRLAEVAVAGGVLVGLAECTWLSGHPESNDLAVLVADVWQQRGVGLRLLTALLERCWDAQLDVVHAESDQDNVVTMALARSLQRHGSGRGTVSVQLGSDGMLFSVDRQSRITAREGSKLAAV